MLPPRRPCHTARALPCFHPERFAASAAILLLTAQPILAQEPVDPLLLPGIVVTATNVPMGREALPTPASVLTGESLREQGISTVAQALEAIPALAVARSGTEGAQTSIFMRGGESDYVKVLVDGVPLNEAGGSMDLADLSTDQVERIEVVRGPASVLYGSDAVSGVVQIFTRRGRGGPSFEASALGGRGQQAHDSGQYSLMDGSATLAGSAGDLSYSLGGARSWTEGAYPYNNERTFHAANARVGWDGGGAVRAALSTRVSNSEAGFPTDGAGNLVDENALIDRRRWTTSAQVTTRISPRLETELQLGVTSRRQLSLDEPDGPADTLGVFASRLESELTRGSADLRLNADLDRATLTIGAAHEISRGSTSYESESEWGPTSADATYDRSNSAAYFQVLAEPLADLHVTTGGRVDHNEAYGRFDTYRAGLSWNFRPDARLRGAVGRAFREPTFAENFGSGFGDVGSEELLPERTRSWEFGAEATVGGILVGATWFDQVFRNMIQYTAAGDDPTDPNYANVGAAESKGLELTGEGALGRVGVSGSYTYLRTRVLDPGLATDETFVEGEPLLRRPAHSASLTARMRLDGGVLGLRANRVGEREDMDFGAGFPAPRVVLPAHTTVDLSGEYEIPSGLDADTRLLVRIENLLDEDFESIRGFPGLGRVVRIGVRVGLGGGS